MIRVPIRFLARTGAILACCSAPAGLAQSTAVAGGSPADVQLTIPVMASVASRCGFAAGTSAASFDAGAIDRAAWSNDFAFTLECSGPSRIAVESRNAGLATALSQPVPGFAALAPYTVAINVAQAAGMTTAACPVASLGSGAIGTDCPLAGNAAAGQGLLIPAASFDLAGSYLRVSAPAYAGPGKLVAGAYEDTLVVTIAPSS